MQEYTISSIKARQIIDSRGNPTVEADVVLSDGTLGRAAVPSGASTGAGEALELRDGDAHWGGKSVYKAVANVNDVIAPALVGHNAGDQKALDEAMFALDGTDNKANLGANAILSVSLAAAKAVAAAKKVPLWRYVADMTGSTPSLPLPMMNVMNGGAHAAGSTDIQEYMIMPIGAATFEDTLRIGTEVFHALKKILSSAGYATTVGDEGGYAPKVQNGNREPLELIKQAVEAAGYTLGTDVALALDVAASELFENDTYNLRTEGRTVSAQELSAWYDQIDEEIPPPVRRHAENLMCIS
jgi:enolase